MTEGPDSARIVPSGAECGFQSRHPPENGNSHSWPLSLTTNTPMDPPAPVTTAGSDAACSPGGFPWSTQVHESSSSWRSSKRCPLVATTKVLKKPDGKAAAHGVPVATV